MATYTISRQPANYAAHPKTLPITMPAKKPTYSYPVSRVAVSPPELSDTSTSYGGSRKSKSAGSYSARSSNYDYAPSHGSADHDSYHARGGVDVVDVLSDRLGSAFDPIRMDRSLAHQTQTSGRLNAKERELQELQALAKRRLKTARVNFAEGVDAGREARADVEYITKKMSSMKTKAEKKHPDAYARASRGRYH